VDRQYLHRANVLMSGGCMHREVHSTFNYELYHHVI